ncbi:MAG: hypothetical protein GTO42_01500 [Candidatus Latescibacteria bacterium]|nr:hypothetical protein [Candidatus Latescibacterota bacterium]NIO27205.1 hypothetical protein [Candidatus Latescibacterota bacterium]NIO54729.1 hypothetical protein [Candidatus Latescibacterota bacterium]NIT00812.1 hypothetical protein [Candidatus Latescibacterota bacterium]NIT37735.1 hypothetical protein [Candidatus Latescibacterota bacterium]
MRKRCFIGGTGIILASRLLLPLSGINGSTLGLYPYDRFDEPDICAECHIDISSQYSQSLMSQCFTHMWDEIEYFELALPHSQKEPKVAEVEAGCNGCHAPLAYLAGDIPPKRPAEGTRANESVSCDICHTMTGFEGDTPFNFNYAHEPGDTKQGVRKGTESPGHLIKVNPFLNTAELCGVCHNEKDPFGQWVKATHLEWKDGPYAKAGITCQDCHLPAAPGKSDPEDGIEHPDVRQHLFHGAHDTGKLLGSIEVRIHPNMTNAAPGDEVKLTAVVINAKAGHMIPSGSAEERVVWIHVEAVDADGRRHHLPVDRKGFDGEAFTIASSTEMAYQDIGEIQDIPEFQGLKRDGSVPDGDRIFRLPYLDPQGRMTIAQWNTAGFGPDYRLAPLEAVTEGYTWKLSEDMPEGPVIVRATVWYSRLIDSVAQFLAVPAAEYEPVKISEHATTFTIVQH